MSDGGWARLPEIPWGTGQRMDAQSELGVSVAGVFRTLADLGSCAQVAVALWDSSQGSDVQVFLLRRSLQKDLQAIPQWQHLTISPCTSSGLPQAPQDITTAEERASSIGRQSRHMDGFDDLDLERAPQEWQIHSAPSLLPYGEILSVILSWNPAGTHLALGLSTSRDNAWIRLIPFEPSASESPPPSMTSWKEDVLTSSFHPATPVSKVALSASQRSSLLQQLQWLPDGSAVMAIDRLGNLGAVNGSGTVQRLSIKGGQHTEMNHQKSAMHLSHAERGISGGPTEDAFTLCLYEDAHTGTTHLALLHGCHLTIYGVMSNSKAPVPAPAPAQRLTWDQAEEIPLHDSPERNSAAGTDSLDGASATSATATDDGLRRTKSARPLSRLTSALRADLDLLTRCVSAPGQLAEAPESLSTPASRCEPQGSPKGDPVNDLSFNIHLRVKTGLPSMHGKHHLKTPRVPKPEDSGDLRQAINTINSAPVGSAPGLYRRRSSGQDRRVSFAELDEVVQTKGPCDPQERILVTALRTTVSADDEQHKAAAPVEGAAYDQDSGPSGALLGAQHLAGGLHAAENSEEGPAGLPHAATKHDTSANSQKDNILLDTHASSTGPRGVGALRAKVARLKAQWSAMLKPAAATKGDGSIGSERGAVPNLAAAQLDGPKSSSAPDLGRPSLSHRGLAGPLVESRMTGWLGAGTGVGEEEGGVAFPGTQRARWMQKGHASDGAVQASLQEPDMMQGNGNGRDAALELPMVAAEEDISDSEWLPAADLWGPSVYVLPEQHRPDPISHITVGAIPAVASTLLPQFQNGASSERSHGATGSTNAAMKWGPRPVAESVEEAEDPGVGSRDPHAASGSAEAHAETSDEHTAPLDKPEEEALTLDQQLSGGRPHMPPRPRSSSGLPRQVLQVDAETSASLDRYYSLPATLPTVSLDAPLLQSRTSLLPGAWASGAFGDALDEFFLDSPTMLDSPVLDRGEPTFEHSIMEQRAKNRERGQIGRKRGSAKRSATTKDPPQVNIRSSGESARQVSPQRSLSPLAGRFAFSWHRAAQDTAERKPEAPSAEHPSTDSQVHPPVVAADDGPPEQLAEYMHTGPGPLEEGLAIARSNALLLNTPDPLRLDPMRTLGSVRRRWSSSSEGSQQRLCSERDPLNQDTVQYAASPLRRMQTLAEAGGPGGTSPVQATPTRRTRRRRSHASVTGDTAPTTAAGCECLAAAQKITTTATQQGKGREPAQETPRVINAGFDESGAKKEATVEKAARGMHRGVSSSTRKTSAGNARQASRSHRVQVESNADSSSVLSRSLSSSSLDVYQMLKGRSRRAHRKRHAQLTEHSSLSSPSSTRGPSMSLGENVACRHLSTPRLLRPDSLWRQNQQHATPAHHSGIRLVDVDWRWGENRAGRPPSPFWESFSSGNKRRDSNWESKLRLLRVDVEKPRAAFQVRRQAEPLRPRLSALEHTEQPENSSLSLLQELKGLVLSLKATQTQKDTAQEAGAAKKVAAARRIQAVYRGHAARRTAALLRLAQQKRPASSSPKNSTRDAAVQAVMPSSTAAQTDSDPTQSPQGTRLDGLYRAVPVRAVYVRPGTSLIKATTNNEQAAAQQPQPQPAGAGTAAEVAALESLRARMSHTAAAGARCHSQQQESEGDWSCHGGGTMNGDGEESRAKGTGRANGRRYIHPSTHPGASWGSRHAHHISTTKAHSTSLKTEQRQQRSTSMPGMGERAMDMHEVAAQLKGMMASLADVEKIAGALQADNEASRKLMEKIRSAHQQQQFKQGAV
ncbi:hypothetical protein COCOBI_03-1810 [Coccomyxa sp. Obi]|nr:hypothetical protein COCOBI_03-1810 [Coccomyxa sp. Obi]